MPTNALFMQDTYLLEHKAKVTAIGEDIQGVFIRLDGTIFHPKGGGQPDDVGTINGIPVKKLKYVKEEDEVNHYLDGALEFEAGQEVDLFIDKNVRAENVALHSTGHILHSILLASPYQLGPQTACNHFPKQSSVTYKTLGKKMPDKTELALAVQRVIDAQTPLHIIDIGGQRHLEVVGISEPVRCGGTHIKNAQEITNFAFRGAIKFDKKADTFKFSYEAKYNHKLGFFAKACEEEKLDVANAEQELVQVGEGLTMMSVV